MKKIIVIFALSLAIVSCRQSSQTENKVLEDDKPDLKNSVWVNARYLETLEQTKSPLKAQPYADTVMVSFNAKADTANIVWNFHEGSAYSVKQGDKIELFNTYELNASPEFSGKLENSILKFDNTAFQEVDTIGFVEKKFWIGKYTANGRNIEVKANNQLSGIDSLSSYRVWVDYVTTQTDIDLIDLGKKGLDQFKTYGYRFAGNEVIFYEFIWTEDGVIGKADKEVSRWKRK